MDKSENLFSKLLKFITYKKNNKPKEFYIPEPSELNIDDAGNSQNESVEENSSDISKQIKVNIDFINTSFNAKENMDIIIREFKISGKYKAFLAFIMGMADRDIINLSILRPLLTNNKLEDVNDECQLDTILQSIIEVNKTKKITDKNEALSEILSGNTIVYVDGCDYYITAETKGFDKRSVERPQIEGVVSGPQEGFTETLRTNITLIRKSIKNNDLVTEFIKLETRNKTTCAIMYIKGLTNPAIISEVKRRIESIKADYISGDGIIEQYIEDSPYSLFPTILSTERPDRAVSHLIEGRVAIIVEGAPSAKIVPVTFASFMHSPEDSFMKWQYGTVMRFVRFAALAIATLLPGLYVAITNFHQEMIPTELLIAIAKAKENVPFPVVVEVLLMELSFELIREAGIRIPGLVGNTLGIIGALILGQAAVEANIVSPILIIVVAVTGLSNFALPNFPFAFAIRIIRFIFIFSGALLGFYGITISFLMIICIMLSMKSFGVNYFAPIAPRTRTSRDFFIKHPIWKQEYRPDFVNALDDKSKPKVSRAWTQEDPDYSYERKNSDD
jgi:spore germination protein KA